MNPVMRSNSAMKAAGEVTVESYTTVALPASYETSASSTPSTLLRATRAVVAQLVQVIPVTARCTVA